MASLTSVTAQPHSQRASPDQDFDPDAVDFEPLLVTGSELLRLLCCYCVAFTYVVYSSSFTTNRMLAGKILSYHSQSFNELDEIDSDCSSVATPIARNGIHVRQALRVERFIKQTSVRTPYRFIRLLSALFILGLFALGGLFWFTNDSNHNTSYRLQTTEAKTSNKLNANTINTILQNHIMDVNVAAFKASTSQVTFWEPYLERSASSSFEVLNSLMNIMSQCFAREVFNFHTEKSGRHVLKPPEIQDGFSSLLSINSGVNNMPRVVFTPNFMQAAHDLLDPFNQGAFITIFHDPIEMYLDHHVKQREVEKTDKLKLADNLLVRYLSGVDDADRKVNKDDYDIARHILVSKFVIGSCDNPAETLNRLDKMIIDSDRIVIASGECTSARKRWNQECKKMKKIGQRIKGNQSYQKLLKRITNTHRYDIQLYEESRKLFREQSALFR